MTNKKLEYPAIRQVACLNGFTLKIIAITTMIVDHIGFCIFPEYIWLRYVGRISLPIFLFLLVEGFFYTKNVRKYEIRLLIFALISEIPYDLAFNNKVFDFTDQNIFFGLLLGVIMLDILETLKCRMKGYNIWTDFLVVVLFCFAFYFLHVDYGVISALFIYCFYKARNYHLIKGAGCVFISLLVYVWGRGYSIISLVPIYLYNGKRGPTGNAYSKNKVILQFLKYIFYIIYPLHIVILYIISWNLA